MLFRSILIGLQLPKQVLILQVATTSVEGCFSAMNVVNTKLCNKMGDQFMSDCLSFLCGEMPIFIQLVMMTCLTF